MHGKALAQCSPASSSPLRHRSNNKLQAHTTASRCLDANKQLVAPCCHANSNAQPMQATRLSRLMLPSIRAASDTANVPSGETATRRALLLLTAGALAAPSLVLPASAAAAAPAAAPQASSPTTVLRVATDIPTDEVQGHFASLRAAIAAAPAGATIRVAAGTYRERIVLDKPLTIEAETEVCVSTAAFVVVAPGSFLDVYGSTAGRLIWEIHLSELYHIPNCPLP